MRQFHLLYQSSRPPPALPVAFQTTNQASFCFSRWSLAQPSWDPRCSSQWICLLNLKQLLIYLPVDNKVIRNAIRDQNISKQRSCEMGSTTIKNKKITINMLHKVLRAIPLSSSLFQINSLSRILSTSNRTDAAKESCSFKCNYACGPIVTCTCTQKIPISKCEM